MKKLISLLLCICLVLGSISFAFAATQDVSDALTHSALNTINNAIGGTGGVLSKLTTISSYLSTLASSVTVGGFSGTQVEWTAKCASILDDIYNAIVGTSGSSGIASILQNILNEFTQTTAGGSVIHFFSNINTNVNTTKTLTNDIKTLITSLNTTVSSLSSTITGIKTNQDNYYPGFGAYLNSIDLTTDSIYDQDTSWYGMDQLWYAMDQNWYTLDQSNGMGVLSGGSAITIRTLNTDGTVRENIIDLSAKNWRDNQIYMFWNQLNTITRGTGMIAAYYNDVQTRTSWLTNQQQTYTPTSFAKGVYYWLSSIQTPLARLAYVHASDQEILAREKAATNQAAIVTNFVDSNGNGSVPSSSFGSLAGLSSGIKDNVSTDVAPNRLLDVFNSSHGTWFSQEIADSLDTTSNTRKSKSYDTPLLDERINEIYNLIGGDKK